MYLAFKTERQMDKLLAEIYKYLINQMRYLSSIIFKKI